MASELISKTAYDALRDTYVEHPLTCECPSCESMDALLDAMCNQIGCRKPATPGNCGCEDHPHRRQGGCH